MVTEEIKGDPIEKAMARFATLAIPNPAEEINAVLPWATDRESRLSVFRTLAADKSIRAVCPPDVQWEEVFAKARELKAKFSSDIVKTPSDALQAVLAQLEREEVSRD